MAQGPGELCVQSALSSVDIRDSSYLAGARPGPALVMTAQSGLG